MKHENSKPSIALKIFIWISVISALIGEFFKIYHFPGASLLLILGAFFFSFFYLPLYFIEQWKQRLEIGSKLLLISQVIIIFLFSIGLLFVTLHWKGSGFFYSLNNSLLFFIVIPFALFHLVKVSRYSSIKTHNLFLVIYFTSHFISALLTSGVNKIKVDGVLLQGRNTEKVVKALTERNKQVYLNIEKIDTTQKSVISEKAKAIKSITDKTLAHIRDLKSHLLAAVDGISKQKADTSSVTDIIDNNEIEIPTQILIGNIFSINKGKYSALSLKTAINIYKDSAMNLVQKQNQSILRAGLNLNTENITYDNGEIESWELCNFYNMPIVIVFNSLTNLQYEIKNVEYQVLMDILNSENKYLNSKLLQEVKELNTKFDIIKKQEEINRLQNENTKGMELLADRDSEINNSRQTILYFVMVVLFFFVLIFFIFRSSYLRKKANNQLRAQKEIIENQRDEVEKQKNLIEEKQKEIIDSIEYALRIQNAILPPQKIVKQYLEDSFILYKPKDIVAGDFYWMESVKDYILFAACDCTGHGVPGAMVSVVCHNALNRALREFGLTQPSQILDKTAEIVVESFSKSEEEIKDGMDISICGYDPSTKILSWSGANNHLWLIQNKEFREIKSDKQSIGINDSLKSFTNHSIQLNTGDVIYLFTDGYADQFGGEGGDKKLTRKKFKEQIMLVQNLPMNEQGNALNNFIVDYAKNTEQMDDILVIGVKV